jgi:hypothetical protein
MAWLTNLYFLVDNRLVFTAALVVVLLFWFVLFPRASRQFRRPDDPSIVALQLAFTKRRFVEILDTWMEHSGFQAIGHARDSIVRLDFIFPVAYALMGASAVALLTARPPAAPSPLVLGLFMLPLLAAVADLGENLCHLRLLSGLQSPNDLPKLPARLIRLASVFSAIKVLLIVDGVQVLLVLLVLWLVR